MVGAGAGHWVPGSRRRRPLRYERARGARGNRQRDPTPTHPGDCHSFHKAEGRRPSRCPARPLPWQVQHCCEAEQMRRPGLAGAGGRRRPRGPSASHSSCLDLHELTITGSPTFPSLVGVTGVFGVPALVAAQSLPLGCGGVPCRHGGGHGSV